ncbi:MAG: hypothetical protein IJJ26_00520 [Victivallales bacterium]|nr:hypothetical protein [Victivallales bacterium]
MQNSHPNRLHGAARWLHRSNSAYELILDRRLGDLYQVPDGWYICTVGNRIEDVAVSTTMTSALANRFMHVELGEDVEAWVHWATQHNIHP